MRSFGLVLVLCSAVALVCAPTSASAFEVQGEDAQLPETPAQFHGLDQGAVLPEFKGRSLAMPFTGEDDGGHISDYGNSIPIPGPGIDRPTPAYSYRPTFR